MSVSKSKPRTLPDGSLLREAGERMPQLRSLLLPWFRKHARKLPWRSIPKGVDRLHSGGGRLRRSPYAEWIAEIMLQQTQVTTVIPYFEKWMRRFPTAGALALAGEADVLRHWAGLGYYARARNLHKAAKQLSIQKRYPASTEGWLALPGIGLYTAGAIASLAFDHSEPILDGNVTRVLSRVFGLAFLPGDGAPQKEAYWELARLWARGKNPGDANEGLMELGALICTPAAPRCEKCPLASGCLALKQGWQNSLPPAKKRQRIEAIHGVAILGRSRGKILMAARPKGSFLAGHDMFPLYLGDDASFWERELSKRFGFKSVGKPKETGEIKHSIMNHRYVLRVLRVDLQALDAKKIGAESTWISEKEIETRLTNSLARKLWAG